MATGTTTSSQVGAPVQEFYDRVLLDRAIDVLVHDKFGQKRPIKPNSGEQPKFRRFSSLTNKTQPLVETVTPSPDQLSKTDKTGQLQQFGNYVELSDYVQYTTEDPILAETATLLGENAGESLDLVYRDTLAAGTSVFYANDVAGRSSIVTAQSTADYKKIERALMNNNAKMFRDKPIVGSDKVGTSPVWNAFFAIIDSYAYYDLRSLSGFLQRSEYPDGGASAMDNEIGSLGHIRFVVCNNAKVWASSGGSVGSTGYKSTDSSNIDVHTALIFGKNAYGITPLEGKAMENIIKPLGFGNDPLNQRSTSGWKATTDCLILNENFMYRYEFAVTE